MPERTRERERRRRKGGRARAEIGRVNVKKETKIDFLGGEPRKESGGFELPLSLSFFQRKKFKRTIVVAVVALDFLRALLVLLESRGGGIDKERERE